MVPVEPPGSLARSARSSATSPLVPRQASPLKKKEYLLNLRRRTVTSRSPERARKEGCTGPKRLNDTPCTNYRRRIKWREVGAIHRQASPLEKRWEIGAIGSQESPLEKRREVGAMGSEESPLKKRWEIGAIGSEESPLEKRREVGAIESQTSLMEK